MCGGGIYGDLHNIRRHIYIYFQANAIYTKNQPINTINPSWLRGRIRRQRPHYPPPRHVTRTLTLSILIYSFVNMPIDDEDLTHRCCGLTAPVNVKDTR